MNWMILKPKIIARPQVTILTECYRLWQTRAQHNPTKTPFLTPPLNTPRSPLTLLPSISVTWLNWQTLSSDFPVPDNEISNWGRDFADLTKLPMNETIFPTTMERHLLCLSTKIRCNLSTERAVWQDTELLEGSASVQYRSE